MTPKMQKLQPFRDLVNLRFFMKCLEVPFASSNLICNAFTDNKLKFMIERELRYYTLSEFTLVLQHTKVP